MPRIAIVTGASAGIGRAICRRLLKDKWTVVGIARDFAKFGTQPKKFYPVSIDLSDLKHLPEKLKTLAKRFPSPDAIVCNAGRGQFGSLEEFSYDQIRSFLEFNFLSHVYLVRAFIPEMKKRRKGDIVVIGSEAGLSGKQRGTLYCSSKFALRGFAQSLREECAQRSVRVSIINPGMVKTRFFDSLGLTYGKSKSNYLLPEDIAQAVFLILSSRRETVFDEMNLSPLQKVVVFRS